VRIVVTYLLSFTLSDIWRTVGPIFAVDRGTFLTHSLEVKP